MNNRAVVNVCANVTLPALSNQTFGLIICTKSYKSSLLEAANNSDDVYMDAIANDIKGPFYCKVRLEVSTEIRE